MLTAFVPRLQSDGLLPSAVLRDPRQLPDLRSRAADRSPAGRQGAAPEPGVGRDRAGRARPCLANPCHGAVRVEQELRLKDIQVSAGRIRGVRQRNGLLTKHERLLRLE